MMKWGERAWYPVKTSCSSASSCPVKGMECDDFCKCPWITNKGLTYPWDGECQLAKDICTSDDVYGPDWATKDGEQKRYFECPKPGK